MEPEGKICTKRVTIVIPAFNEQELLPKCLEAIGNQDYRGELEILVVNNASTDATARIAKEHGADVIDEPRPGYRNALVRGFAAASGDIIACTDADTIVPPYWISRLVSEYDRHPDVVAIGGDLLFTHASPKSWFMTQVMYPWLSWLDRRNPKGPHLCGANLSVRRDAFEKVGGWNPRFNLHADLELSERIRCAGRVLRLDSLPVKTSSRRWNKSPWPNAFIHATGYASLHLFHRPLWQGFTAVRDVPRNDRPGLRRVARRPMAGLAGVVTLVFGIVAYGAVNPRSNAFGRTYWNGATERKVVALTFDDGPNEPYTSQVLSILKREHVRATFFLVGCNVRCYPETAARIAMEGHVVANHSDTHPVGFAIKPVRMQRREVDAAEETIHAATGRYPRFFRPPMGLRSPWLMSVLTGDSLVAVTWDDTPLDWLWLPSSKLVRRALDQAHPGAIILLHDGLNSGHGVDRSQTVLALPEIIKGLRARGYSFCTVPELLGGRAYLSRWPEAPVRADVLTPADRPSD